MKQARIINILLTIFVFLGFASLVASYTIGGCYYADNVFTVTNAEPAGTVATFDCATILINGESQMEHGVNLYDQDNNAIDDLSIGPDSAFGKKQIIITNPPDSEKEYRVEGYTTYNTYGKIKELLGFFWLVVVLLIVTKLILRVRSKTAPTNLNPEQ